jgi:hypothetical protein
MDMNEARIATWKRMEWAPTQEGLEEKVDYQIIVDGGKVVTGM